MYKAVSFSRSDTPLQGAEEEASRRGEEEKGPEGQGPG